MSVPDLRDVPLKLYATGFYNLRSHDGQAAFTDAVVTTLHGLNSNFRHLKKSASQTHVHRHGEDSVIYLLPDDKALAVDFIGGAGGPNPQPGWIVGTHLYTHEDAHDPSDHGIGAHAQPAPTPVMPKGEAFAALKALDAFYRAPEGLQRPDGIGGDMEAIAQWFYQLVIERVPLEAVFAQIRNSHEWKSKHP
jgi:hypothetical protein